MVILKISQLTQQIQRMSGISGHELGKTIMTLYVYVIFDNTCRAFPPGKYNSSQIYLKMKNLNSL